MNKLLITLVFGMSLSMPVHAENDEAAPPKATPERSVKEAREAEGATADKASQERVAFVRKDARASGG